MTDAEITLLTDRLDRIEQKVDGVVANVAEMRGERAAEIRHDSWRHGLITAVVGGLAGAFTAKFGK